MTVVVAAFPVFVRTRAAVTLTVYTLCVLMHSLITQGEESPDTSCQLVTTLEF